MGDPVVLSWAQVLCEPCQNEIRDRGWRPKHNDLLAGTIAEIRCQACRESFQQLKDQHHSPITAVPFLWATEPERAELTRLHEAAHVVIGEHLGMPVSEVLAERSGVDLAGSRIGCAGGIGWQLDEPPSTPVLATMAFAGPEMARAHLHRRDRATPEAILDAAYSGASDMAILATDPRGPVPDDLADRTQADAVGLLDTYAAEIHAVAAALATTPRLDRHAVLAAMHHPDR